MDDQMSAWEWLKTTIAAEVGADRAAEIFAEYNRRADRDEHAYQVRRHLRQFAEARAELDEGMPWAARRIARVEAWLRKHGVAPPAPAVLITVGEEEEG